METHQSNFGKMRDYLGDIRLLTEDKINEIWGDQNIELIIGSPVCTGFSGNNIAKRYSKETKEKNQLFINYLTIVKVLKPKICVIENVQQMFSWKKGIIKDVMTAYFQDIGYSLTYKVLNSKDYGVPQARKRLIIVAVRNDLGKTFNFDLIPKKQTVTVKEAISDLYEQPEQKTIVTKDPYVTEPQTAYQTLIRDDQDFCTLHLDNKHSKSYINRIKHVPQGGNLFDVLDKYPECFADLKITENTHNSRYHRVNENDFSRTIDSKISHTHPQKNRALTVREGARLQSFPDSFKFVGSKTSIKLQIGNAVPPLMAKSIAEEISKQLIES